MKRYHRPHRRQCAQRPAKQDGSFLIEALFGILIFSIGILGLVGLQMSAIKQSSDANYRSEAAMYANELVGTMWVSDRTPAVMKTNFEPGGNAYIAWAARLTSLPGVTATTNLPSVSVDTVTSTVNVTVRWQAPGAEIHQHLLIAQIK